VTHPLAGLRVVELASDIAGPYATKLLADAGADVVKVEHPEGGDPMRRFGVTGDEGGASALFRFLNTSKRSVAIDWRSAAGREQLLALAASADLVVESLAPEAGLDSATIAERSPRTSLVSISWFGRSGPWRDRRASDLTIQALCGSIALRGTVERPPLAAGGRLAEWLGGGFAAIGALTAAVHARATGRAQHVDLSLLEVAHVTMSPFTTVGDSLSGRTQSIPRMLEIPSIEPAADGFVGFCTITNQQWRDFLVLIERGDLVDDAGLGFWLTRNERRREVYAMIHAWTRRHTIAEIIERAIPLRIPVAEIGNGATVTAFDHFRERGTFVRHPGADFVQPRIPYRLGRGTLRPFTPSPALGAHTAEALAEARAGTAASDRADPWHAAARRDDEGHQRAAAKPRRDGESHGESDETSGSAPRAPERPFAGLRVIDFTMFWAGPFVTHFLATLGADVIKVESTPRPDGIRFASTRHPPEDRWWEWSAMFHGINAGKRGITLDLSRPEGVALARRLIARADAVVENFSPRVLDNLGLRYEELARDNPGLVFVRMPAFGLDGPWRDRVGFAQTMEQVSGMAWVTGFADAPPVIPRGPCDPLAGMHATFALLVALEHRRRTGEGQLVEATMVEAALNATAEQVLTWQTHGVLLGRDGNRGRVGAPENVYACSGTERWLALSVVTDEHWQALVEAMGRPGWATAPDLATHAGRAGARDRIEHEVERWCATRELESLLDDLVARGVPAAPVVPGRHVDRNPQMRARGFFEPVAHPITGTHEIPGLPMRFSAIPDRWYRSPAPTLGQHGPEVLRDLLGLDDREIDRLRAAGIIGERPLGA
jgi:crotonobetainyl-CoA:carnitine CoA-transferase CaiB-like acyl-CoA transferase